MTPTTILLLSFEFLFVAAYLIVLYQVISDVLRDPELGGLGQALWIFFVLLVPLVAVAVYLVARGPRMAMRRRAAVRDTEQQAQEYIRAVAGTGPAQQVRVAKDLYDEGTLTHEQFEQLKAQALAA